MPRTSSNPAMKAQLRRMAKFLRTLEQLALEGLVGPIQAPQRYLVLEASYAMYEPLLVEVDGDDQELVLLLSLLPTITSLAEETEELQAEVAGDLLKSTRQLATRIRKDLAAAKRCYGITDADIAAWHVALTEEPTVGVGARSAL